MPIPSPEAPVVTGNIPTRCGYGGGIYQDASGRESYKPQCIDKATYRFRTAGFPIEQWGGRCDEHVGNLDPHICIIEPLPFKEESACLPIPSEKTVL